MHLIFEAFESYKREREAKERMQDELAHNDVTPAASDIGPDRAEGDKKKKKKKDKKKKRKHKK